MEMPKIRRFLRALDVLANDADPDNRKYANQMYRDMSVPSVTIADCLDPIMTLPLAHLKGPERRHRLVADSDMSFAPLTTEAVQ